MMASIMAMTMMSPTLKKSLLNIGFHQSMLMQLILLVSHHLVGTDWSWPWMSSRVQVEFEYMFESSRVEFESRSAR